MKSVMSHSFSQIPEAKIPRSIFNRSHGYKTTFDAGYLVPVYVDEVLPGDTFNMKMTSFARMATPIYPIMDNIKLDSFFFAVPLRLIWSNFKKFMGEQVDPGDSTDYTVPVLDDTKAPIHTTGFTAGSLDDYFGLPVGVIDLTNVSSLWHRAYNAVWNDWFRDENLQDSVVVDLDDGPDDPADYVLLRRGKRHDYFTSCLPWPQKGESVELPLGETARVTGIGVNTAPVGGGPYTMKETDDSPNTVQYADAWISSDGSHAVFVKEDPSNANYPYVHADLSTATAATINEIRNAFQIQRMYERDARGGTRYIEIVRSHFGVVSPDSRHQRPEYLGGGTCNINVHPIAQTSETGATNMGSLAAFATGSAIDQGFVKSFTEHCVIIGMVCARADLNYQEGLPRMFSRQTRHDFYWPSLAHLGEQAVLNKEIYCDATANDEDVFGYQERYAEYRYKPSMVTNHFRSSHATTLDAWHLSQEFGALPTLDDTFIVENPPVDRVIATPTEPHFILDCYFDLKCARPMPVYSAPGLIDHF